MEQALCFDTDMLSRYLSAESPIWMSQVRCPATAKYLGDCNHAGWGKTKCGHGDDLGVICEDEQDFSAASQRARMEGSVARAGGRGGSADAGSETTAVLSLAEKTTSTTTTTVLCFHSLGREGEGRAKLDLAWSGTLSSVIVHILPPI